VKYACIARHEGEHAVRLMCRVLAVAPAGYYRWRAHGPSAHAIADAALLVRVREAFHGSDDTYGAPRIHRDLRDEGVPVGKKRVASVMRRNGLVARARRAWVHTTDSAHAYPIAENVLDRQFAIAEPDRVWVSDITYVPTRLGFLFLAVVIDLASRRVVGWAMREDMTAALALEALRTALAARRPAPGLLHHSDRGVQYACGAYRQLLEANGLRASMSRKGNCWDNAVAESFFATLEWELIARRDWRNPDEARQDIFEYIETWYNRRRRHSSLDYRSPAQYETQLRARAA
jgi:putative transposase